jgi:membrane associated rhomboid family serine protease
MFPLRDDNPTRIKPILTLALIVANTLVFFYQLSLGARQGELFVYQYGSIPAVLFGIRQLPSGVAAIPPFLSLFTSMFLHGGWLHLIGNMWYLWIFGNNIEEAMGRFRFILFYMLSGLAASMCQSLANVGSVIPSIGASGAISGVLGAYLLLYPRARVLVLIPLGLFTQLIYIPAVVVLGFWFVLQLLSGSFSNTQAGGVAWWAHVGGFLAGMLLVGLFKKREVRFFSRPGYRSPSIDF